MKPSLVLIVPAVHRDEANALGASMGWGNGNFSVPLSDDGVTVTHYGCRLSVSQAFLDVMLTDLIAGVPWGSQLINDVADDKTSHFDTVVADYNLQVIDTD